MCLSVLCSLEKAEERRDGKCCVWKHQTQEISQTLTAGYGNHP